VWSPLRKWLYRRNRRPGRVEMNRMSSDADGSVWTTKVSELKNGVHVALAILSERLDDLPILVLNSSDEPCKVMRTQY